MALLWLCRTKFLFVVMQSGVITTSSKMVHINSRFLYPFFSVSLKWFLNNYVNNGFPGDAVVKNPPVNAGDTRDTGWSPVPRRSPGVENGNPLQFSCPGKHMHRGAKRATAHGCSRRDSASMYAPRVFPANRAVNPSDTSPTLCPTLFFSRALLSI